MKINRPGGRNHKKRKVSWDSKNLLRNLSSINANKGNINLLSISNCWATFRLKIYATVRVAEVKIGVTYKKKRVQLYFTCYYHGVNLKMEALPYESSLSCEKNNECVELITQIILSYSQVSNEDLVTDVLLGVFQ